MIYPIWSTEFPNKVENLISFEWQKKNENTYFTFTVVHMRSTFMYKRICLIWNIKFDNQTLIIMIGNVILSPNMDTVYVTMSKDFISLLADNRCRYMLNFLQKKLCLL